YKYIIPFHFFDSRGLAWNYADELREQVLVAQYVCYRPAHQLQLRDGAEAVDNGLQVNQFMRFCIMWCFDQRQFVQVLPDVDLTAFIHQQPVAIREHEIVEIPVSARLALYLDGQQAY